MKLQTPDSERNYLTLAMFAFYKHTEVFFLNWVKIFANTDIMNDETKSFEISVKEWRR